VECGLERIRKEGVEEYSKVLHYHYLDRTRKKKETLEQPVSGPDTNTVLGQYEVETL
jgi:hypothetical protein